MGVVVWQARWVDNSADAKITHSYIFSVCVIVILIFGRAINVMLVIGLGKMFSKKFDIKMEEIFILIVSGLAKGATPFALFTNAKIGGNS